MHFLSSFSDLRLDIVGLVAILGEASTVKTARISASSWWHVCPRLMPAPQALLTHQRDKQLPTEKGVVMGVYSGNLARELNFFSHLLHPRELGRFEVEFVTVAKRLEKEDSKPFEMNYSGGIWSLSLSGFATAVTLLALAIRYQDGWALLGIILLALTSTLIGFATRWTLIWEKPDFDHSKSIPDSDVCIFYPAIGAFRVIRCDEETHRLYFVPETIQPLLGDGLYRFTALSGTLTLIFGLVCIGNAREILQLSFAATYVFLNVIYWAGSALPVEHQWSHNYDIHVHKVKSPANDSPIITDDSFKSSEQIFGGKAKQLAGQDIEKNAGPIRPRPMVTNLSASNMTSPFRIVAKGHGFTKAMWTAIALTGTSEWLTRASIGPQNRPWQEWYDKAGQAAAGNHPDWQPTRERFVQGQGESDGEHLIELCSWPYAQELKKIFTAAEKSSKERPVWSAQQLRRLNIRHGALRVALGNSK